MRDFISNPWIIPQECIFQKMNFWKWRIPSVKKAQAVIGAFDTFNFSDARLLRFCHRQYPPQQ
jgi:hypothetical protein